MKHVPLHSSHVIDDCFATILLLSVAFHEKKMHHLHIKFVLLTIIKKNIALTLVPSEKVIQIIQDLGINRQNEVLASRNQTEP